MCGKKKKSMFVQTKEGKLLNLLKEEDLQTWKIFVCVESLVSPKAIIALVDSVEIGYKQLHYQLEAGVALSDIADMVIENIKGFQIKHAVDQLDECRTLRKFLHS